MGCNTASGVQAGIEGECPTIDIRCIPQTEGQPTAAPQPDQLPLAWDEETSTLWIHVCDEGWYAFSNSLCRLDPVDIDVLNNLCQVLNIPVTYDINGQCVEGNITLEKLAEKVVECVEIDTDISSFTATAITINTVKVTITEDEKTYDVYIEGEDVWFSGNGTELDPLIIRGPALVDGTGTELVKDIDPVTGKITYTVNLATCELPTKTQGEVDAALSVMQSACVDGESVLIPLRPLPEPTAPYECVPVISEIPTAPPAPDTGPLRVHCDGSLWVYKCDETGWELVRPSVEGLELLDPADVANICENLKFIGWDGTDENCLKLKELSLQQLAVEIQKCLGCQDTVVVEQASVGGGVCVAIAADTPGPTPFDPIIYQARDNTILSGAGTIAAASGTVMYLQDLLTNPWSDCPCLVEVTLSVDPNRTIVEQDIAISWVFRIGSTLIIPVPVLTGAQIREADPTTIWVSATYPSYNADYDVGIYSANTPGQATYFVELAPGASSTVFSQWWAFFAPYINGPVIDGLSTTIHGGMHHSVKYHRNGRQI